MGRVLTVLLDCASHLLPPAEREVVLGDIAEAGESTRQALLDISRLDRPP